MNDPMTLTNGMIITALVIMSIAAGSAWLCARRLQAGAVEFVSQNNGNLRAHLGSNDNPHHVLDNTQVWLICLFAGGALSALIEVYVGWRTFGHLVSEDLGAIGPLLGLAVASAGQIVIAILMHEIFKGLEWYRHRANTTEEIHTEKDGIIRDKYQNTLLLRVLERVLPRYTDNPERTSEVTQRATNYISATVPNIEGGLVEETRGRVAQLRHAATKIAFFALISIIYWITYFYGVTSGAQAQLEQAYSRQHEMAYMHALEIAEGSQTLSLQASSGTAVATMPQRADFSVTERELLTARRSAASVAAIILILQLLLGGAIGLVLINHEHAANDVARLRYWDLIADRKAQQFDEILLQGEASQVAAVAPSGFRQRGAPASRPAAAQSAAAGRAPNGATSPANNARPAVAPPIEDDWAAAPGSRRDAEPEPVASNGHSPENQPPAPDDPPALFRLPRRPATDSGRRLV